MTVEAGDCNGKSEGSKKVELELEVKQGGDLKENGNACRDREGEEIGGSFVIVNGDSDDQSSDKDDPKSDPTVENGEMVLEKGKGGSEEKEVRSNGDVEVGGGDHEKIVGTRSDADVAEKEEVDVEIETAKVEETEKQDVEIEEGEVEEMVVEVEKGEELEVVEEDREGRVAASENVNEGNLGCRVEKVTAAKELESEPASQVNDEVEPVVSENGSDGDLGSAIKEGDKMEIVVMESGRVEMLEPVSQVNEAPEPETVVVELGRVEVLEPVSHVSEEPEPETVVVESGSEEELELVSQVNEEPEPETVVVESGSVEVLEPISQVNEETEPVVSKKGSRGDLGHAIEGEDAAGSVVVESDSLKGFKPVSQVNEEPEPVVSENGRVADLESTIKEEDIKESVVVVSDSLEGSEPASQVNEEVVLNKGSKGDLESEDVTETVVVEWGSLEGSEPASQVNEVLQPFVSSNRSKGDLESTIEEEDTTETVVVESDSLEGFEPISQVNEGAEPVLSENGSKGDLESTVEEVDATETVVVGSDSVKGLGPASLVSEGLHPESIIETTEEKGDIEVGEVEESSKHEDVAEEIANVAEGQVDVKVELKDETENVDEEVEKVENVDEEVEKVESAEIEEPKAEIEEPKADVEETYNRAELDSAERQTEITTEVDEVKVLEAVIKETDNQEEVGSAETNTIGANEEKVSEAVIDETGNQEAVGPAATNTIEPSIEKVPEAIIEETDNQVEAGGRVEPDAEKIENAEAKDVSDNLDSTAELSAVLLKDELNGEDINIPPESSEIAHVDCVAEEDLVEGISLSTDVKHVEVEVSSRETVELDPKSDIAIQDDEPRLQTQEFVEDFSHSTDDEYVAVGVSNREIVDLEPKTDISVEVDEPMLETQEPIEDVETNKDVNIEKMKLESNSGNESAVDSECVVSFIVGEQATSKDDDEGANNEQAQAVELQTLPETHVVKLHQIFLAKVPRFIDHELQQKIEDARLVVDEKTKIRDSIGEKAKKQAAIANERMSEYREALFKEKAARAEFNIKRKEIEKEQVLIQSINNASSIADIDEKVRNMNHRQQHETLTLKEEKQYIHEINQMKKVRDQLLSKKAPQDQIDMVLRQKDEIEARVKNLKKELDSCRAALSSAENNTKSAWNRHMEEDKLLRKLKEEHNAADGVRQEAYLHAIKLRNQFNEKAKYFKMYKADQSAATNYIFSGDNQGLRLHCSKQVEKVMDLWNNNRDFREQYVNSNTYSTVRRLGTLDGRSLGLDEEPPILHSTANRSSNITLGPSSNETPVPVSVPEARKGNPAETSVKVERTNQFPKLKSSTKPVVSNSAESKEEERLNKLKKEEEDLARKQEELARKEEELRIAKLAKEEELRKEKAAAELKEQLRLEQKAKAREAEERKRRKSEKAQAKAEYRAQKEAELREKKKAKKGNKKTGITDSTSNRGTEGKNTPALEINPLETSQEPETSSSTSSRKRSSMPVSVMKQYNKVQTPVPLPLRNKSKRKMTTWMWALLVTLLVVALFIAGNYVSFSTSGMHDFGF